MIVETSDPATSIVTEAAPRTVEVPGAIVIPALPTAGGSGAPTDATYLVTTAHADLSAEVVVGATPGGELGGTWASPTVDTTHAGSSHAAVQAAAEATAAAALATHVGSGTHPFTAITGVATDAQIPSTIARDSEVTAAVAAALTSVLGTAPAALDTLGELADALNDDADFAATITAALAAKVAKADYGAHTVLVATSDDNPVAVTISEATLLGRLTGGNIAALTATQIKGLLAIGHADVAGLDEQIRDVIGAALVEGAGITLTVNDAGDTITIDADGGTAPDATNSTCVIDRDDGATVANTTTVTSVLSSALDIPTGLAENGDLFIVELIGTYTNNSGAGRTLTPRFVVGSTSHIGSATGSLTSSANPRLWRARMLVMVKAEDASGLGSQQLGFEFMISGPTANAFDPINTGSTMVGQALSVEPMTGSGVSKALDFRVAHSAADANVSITCTSARLVRIPKYA